MLFLSVVCCVFLFMLIADMAAGYISEKMIIKTWRLVSSVGAVKPRVLYIQEYTVILDILEVCMFLHLLYIKEL